MNGTAAHTTRRRYPLTIKSAAQLLEIQGVDEEQLHPFQQLVQEHQRQVILATRSNMRGGLFPPQTLEGQEEVGALGDASGILQNVNALGEEDESTRHLGSQVTFSQHVEEISPMDRLDVPAIEVFEISSSSSAQSSTGASVPQGSARIPGNEDHDDDWLNYGKGTGLLHEPRDGLAKKPGATIPIPEIRRTAIVPSRIPVGNTGTVISMEQVAAVPPIPICSSVGSVLSASEFAAASALTQLHPHAVGSLDPLEAVQTTIRVKGSEPRVDFRDFLARGGKAVDVGVRSKRNRDHMGGPVTHSGGDSSAHPVAKISIIVDSRERGVHGKDWTKDSQFNGVVGVDAVIKDTLPIGDFALFTTHTERGTSTVDDGKAMTSSKLTLQHLSQVSEMIHSAANTKGGSTERKKQNANLDDAPRLLLPFIMERKKWSDLAHSVIDSRYLIQKRTLLRCGLRCPAVYLLEGVPLTDPTARQRCESAMLTSMLVDGLHVVWSQSACDTVNLLGAFCRAYAIQSKYSGILTERNPTPISSFGPPSLVSQLTWKKHVQGLQETDDIGSLLPRMLCGVMGCSKETALCLAKFLKVLDPTRIRALAPPSPLSATTVNDEGRIQQLCDGCPSLAALRQGSNTLLGAWAGLSTGASVARFLMIQALLTTTGESTLLTTTASATKKTKAMLKGIDHTLSVLMSMLTMNLLL